MYSRNLSFKLKAKSTAEFTRIIEGEIIPLLRRQIGNYDAIGFIASDRNEAVTISLRNKKDDAKVYNQKTHPEILKALSKLIKGAPQAESFKVRNSTSHQIAASAVQ